MLQLYIYILCIVVITVVAEILAALNQCNTLVLTAQLTMGASIGEPIAKPSLVVSFLAQRRFFYTKISIFTS